MVTLGIYPVDQCLDFRNQHWQVWSLKAHLLGRYTVVLHIRWYVLVVGMSRLERRLVGMWLGVVPTELLFAAPDLVTVTVDHGRQAIVGQSLANYQAEAVVELEVASDSGQRGATTREHQGGTSDRRVPLRQAVEE